VTLAAEADADAVRASVVAILGERFGIEHCTIQTEAASEACEANDHLHP
jgi:cobalt-zinc-cadmium efflux system protein